MMTTYEIAAEDCFNLSPEKVLDIETLVKSNLLPLPGSAARILGLLQNADVSTHDISEAIGFDPVLASRVMRLANSPMYAMERSISTVQGAVSAIGVRSVYDIVMLGVAADSFSEDMRSMTTGVSIWEHSVAVALASRTISAELKIRGTEEAFICGLLHDIGKNLLYTADPIAYAEVSDSGSEDVASKKETLIFGFSHAQVGFYVATRWGLADAICSSIMAHHDPRRASEAVVITHIINVADDLVTKKGMGLHIDETTKYPASFSTEYLKITDEQMESTWVSVEKNLREILSTYK